MNKGYFTDSNLVAAYTIGRNTHPEHREENRIMSPQRIDVEWGLGKINTIFPLLQDLPIMKIQQYPISKYYSAAALIVNIHTCLDTNQNVSYLNYLPFIID